jgi:type II secretory pathway component PulM
MARKRKKNPRSGRRVNHAVDGLSARKTGHLLGFAALAVAVYLYTKK